MAKKRVKKRLARKAGRQKRPSKRAVKRRQSPKKKQRLDLKKFFDLDVEDAHFEKSLPSASERMRQRLLEEEFKLRKKQPTAWTFTKYRKFANFPLKKKKEKEPILEEHEASE